MAWVYHCQVCFRIHNWIVLEVMAHVNRSNFAQRAAKNQSSIYFVYIYPFLKLPPTRSPNILGGCGFNLYFVLHHWISVFCQTLSKIDTKKESTIYFLYLHPRNWIPLGLVRDTESNQHIIHL